MGLPEAGAVVHPFDLVVRWAELTPTAVLFSDGITAYEFASAREFARTLAAKLRELGVKPGHIAALELPAGLQVAFILACLHEGVASTTWGDALEVAASLEPDWLFTTERRDSLRAGKVVFVDEAFMAAPSKIATDHHAEFAPRGFASPDDLCRVAFSSGSTGTPKPVALTLDMVTHRAHAAHELWVSGDAFVCILDLGTASGFHTFFAALQSGDTYLAPGNPAHNVELITNYKVRSIKASPIQISLLFDEARRVATAGDAHPLSSLKSIYSAGSVVPPALRVTVRTESNAHLYNLYGSTEVGRAAESEIVDNDTTFAGFVVDDTELEVVDAHDRPVTPGEIGAVRYRRAHMATGYFDDPRATATAFRDGWFYTGDEGSLSSDGRLSLTGRTSDVINLGGVKVQPREVEAFVLSGDGGDGGVQVTGIADAAGFGFTGAGGVEQFALAVVVAPETKADQPNGPQADLAELARTLTTRFGSLAPSAIFALPTIPRNYAGKVDRAELARIYESAVATARRS